VSVGIQATVGGLNSALGNCAVGIRNDSQSIQDLWSYVVSLGANEAAQVAGLEALGFGSSANPVNPGGVSDAQWFWTAANYLYSLSQIYYGLANLPTEFNFDGGLAAVRGGN
jgi:hypothetical protein